MAPVHCFEDFELDSSRFELRRRGTRVSLQPKVLRLLLYLVEHRQRSVSNQELLKELWPGAAVTPASIRRAVAGARRALGERGGCASSIQTVRDYGYRFLLEVHAPPPEHSVVRPSARDHAQSALEPDEHAMHDRLFDGRASTCCKRCLEADGAPSLWSLVQLLRKAREELGLQTRSHARPFADRPLALALDELLRADAATLRLLSFLARQLAESATRASSVRKT